MSKPSNYQSYVLRLWRGNAQAAWQASLQSTATEQVHHFPNLEQMWAFLQMQMGAGGDDAEVGDTLPDASEPDAPD